MLNADSSRSKWSMIILTMAMVAAFSVPTHGQDAPAVHVGNTQINGIPDDWTHHHVVFSDPGTEQDAIRNGTHEQWLKTVNEPRYVIQQLKRKHNVQGPAVQDVEMRSRIAMQEDLVRRQPEITITGRNKPGLLSLKNDWAVAMGTGTHGTAGVYPAKYGFDTGTDSCNDYVVFPTAATGSATVPNMVAYYKLYTSGTLSCNSGSPSQYWAVSLTNGTTYGTVTTSPVLSLDGQQVAFMESVGGSAYLVVVLMPAITSASATITSVTTTSCLANTTVNSAAQSTAPVVWCAKVLGGADDNISSPYYDYVSNTLYVGDNNGILHIFTNVFATAGNTSAPTETAHANPSGGPLASPVYDPGTGNVFVGDDTGVFYSVGTTNSSSSRLTSSDNGITDAAIVDSNAGKVYVFSSDDTLTTGCASTHCSGVFQFSTSSVSGLGNFAHTGSSSLTVPVYSGAFDNAYFSGNGTTGNLYVCGNAGGAPSLYKITMAATFPGTISTGLAVSGTTTATCSQITEVYNGTSDWLFLSETGTGNQTGKCTSTTGCVYNLNAVATTTGGTTNASKTVTSAANFFASSDVGAVISGVGIPANATITNWGSAKSVTISTAATSTNGSETITITRMPTAATAGIAASSGASGIIIDNLVTGTGTSQIYYIELSTTACNTGTGAGGCAVQTVQNTL